MAPTQSINPRDIGCGTIECKRFWSCDSLTVQRETGRSWLLSYRQMLSSWTVDFVRALERGFGNRLLWNLAMRNISTAATFLIGWLTFENILHSTAWNRKPFAFDWSPVNSTPNKRKEKREGSKQRRKKGRANRIQRILDVRQWNGWMQRFWGNPGQGNRECKSWASIVAG